MSSSGIWRSAWPCKSQLSEERATYNFGVEIYWNAEKSTYNRLQTQQYNTSSGITHGNFGSGAVRGTGVAVGMLDRRPARREVKKKSGSEGLHDVILSWPTPCNIRISDSPRPAASSFRQHTLSFFN
jgi:hypothetical protein